MNTLRSAGSKVYGDASIEKYRMNISPADFEPRRIHESQQFHAAGLEGHGSHPVTMITSMRGRLSGCRQRLYHRFF